MNVLSIRGGGIKGILPASILAGLEQLTGKPCRELFGLITGTSTGGILAIALGLGIPAADIVRMYVERGPRIFARRWRRWFGITGARYEVENLLGALRGVYGEARLSDCGTRVMVCSTNVETRRSMLIKSWRDEWAGLGCVTAAAATAAAPTYFDPVSVLGELCCDGGIWANNPCSFALTEAEKLWITPGVHRLVDLGCGDPARTNAPRKRWGALSYAPVLADLVLESGMDAAAHQVAELLSAGYLQAMPAMGGASMAMDDVSERNLNALLQAGRWAAESWAARIVQHLAVAAEARA